jgi:hypothetical protein
MDNRVEMKPKALVKMFLGLFPFSADLDWAINHKDGKLASRFRLALLESQMPRLMEEMAPFSDIPATGKKIFLFASWHYWIVHTALCGLVLRGLGHDVTLGYLPYGDYDKPVSRYDLRLQELYARNVLKTLQPYLKPVSLFDLQPASHLPESLSNAVKRATVSDTQYILQREDVTGEESIYQLRNVRNGFAARRALAYFQKERPDVVIVPNGMVQEFGAVYETARYLNIPAVTYEFGDPNRKVWLAHNNLVIHHNNDDLWFVHKDRKLNPEQRRALEELFAGRRGLNPGENFAHLWQKAEPEGGAKVRAALELDNRPVVLLPTNVLGDTATLGLTIFSKSMTEWLQRVILYLAEKPEIQVVVRIHPAETWTVGPSVAEIIDQVLPELPEHIRLIGSREKVNTYDLMEIADLVLVYTTSVGLEMATRGIPVVVSGRAHYRNKGFTIDADSWDEYFTKLEAVLKDMHAFRLTPDQVEKAWNYAYIFFKEYPRPFPWHVEKIGKDMARDSLSYVLSPEGQSEFGRTFQQLAGAPLV